MDWQVVLGVIAGLIQLGSYVPYIRDIVSGRTKPNIVSWVLWTCTVSIIIFGQISAGSTWAVLLLVGADIGNVVVVVLAATGYGYRKFGAVEISTLILSLSAIVLWRLTAQPIVAIIFAVLGDSIAYAPTLVKVYKDPYSDTTFFWAAIVVADCLAAVAPLKVDIPTLLFTIPYGIMNASVVALIIFRKRFKKA